MAEGREIRVPRSDEPKEDPDFYIRTIAATWGHLDLIKEWIPHHLEDRAKITDHVLIPAAMYGQLEVLKLALKHGETLMLNFLNMHNVTCYVRILAVGGTV